MKRLPESTAPAAVPAVGGTAGLLTALAGGPTVLTVSMIANLALVRAGCTVPATMARVGLALLALGGSAFAMWLSVRLWRRFGRPERDPREAAPQRNHFLALFALASAGGSVALAVYFAAVVLFLEMCWFA